jgi:tRNA threonylcarbamoyl adenosine modification protein YeaZ
MKILAIDTAANLCSACVYDSGHDAELGRAVLDIGTGHAERLMGVIGQALEQAGIGYAGLEAVAVSVGPGSFTGVRVGVATARGLALALSIRAVGVTTLESLANEARIAFPGRPVLAAIDARRNEIYAAFHDADGSLRAGPTVTTVEDTARIWMEAGRPVLTGSAANLIFRLVSENAGSAPALDIASQAPTADIGIYARLAAQKQPSTEKPRPLYLRGADAKPQTGFALPRKAG